MQGEKHKWPWVVGISVAVVAGMMIYGSTIPEYQIQAREVRVACEDLAKIGRADLSTCRIIYDNMVLKGKATENAEITRQKEWDQKLRDNEKMLQDFKNLNSDN